MIVLTLVKRLCQGIDRAASNHLTQQQLRRLDHHQLQDIGLRLEQGRVVTLKGANPATLLRSSMTQVTPDLPAKIAAPELPIISEGSGG